MQYYVYYYGDNLCKILAIHDRNMTPLFSEYLISEYLDKIL